MKHVLTTLAVLSLVACPSTAGAECTSESLTKLTASDAKGFAGFGGAVAVSGDTALVGASSDSYDNSACRTGSSPSCESGAAYVFTRDESGAWTQQAKLNALDWDEVRKFGRSVAISGDTAVIGAIGSVNGGSNPVYVFTREASGSWSQQAKLTASDAQERPGFGSSVAVSGDTVVVGAAGSAANRSGSAYVFTRDRTGSWTQQEKLTALDPMEDNFFGGSVAVDGDIAVVGAPRDLLLSGSAYVFARDETDAWTQEAKLTGLAAGTHEILFGTDVAASGETVVVRTSGTTYFRPGSWRIVSSNGSAYVFNRDASGRWAQDARLTISIEESDHRVISMAFDGTTVVIWADLVSVSGNGAVSIAGSGLASAYRRDETGAWTQHVRLQYPLPELHIAANCVVAVSGNTVLIGMHSNIVDCGETPTPCNAGAANAYELSCPSDSQAEQQVPEDSPGDQNGKPAPSVCGAGVVQAMLPALLALSWVGRLRCRKRPLRNASHC